MNLNLELCQQCNALVETSGRWQHDNWHANMNAAAQGSPCTYCGSLVYDWAKHTAHHERLGHLAELLDRLLGDVEAHLEFMAHDGAT